MHSKVLACAAARCGSLGWIGVASLEGNCPQRSRLVSRTGKGSQRLCSSTVERAPTSLSPNTSKISALSKRQRGVNVSVSELPVFAFENYFLLLLRWFGRLVLGPAVTVD